MFTKNQPSIHHKDVYHSLINLRSSYLQLVASAWGNNRMSDLISFTDEENKSGKDVMELLRTAFGYNGALDMKFYLSKNGPRPVYNSSDGEFMPGDDANEHEHITVYLPKAPYQVLDTMSQEEIDSVHKKNAIAAQSFYHTRPAVFDLIDQHQSAPEKIADLAQLISYPKSDLIDNVANSIATHVPRNTYIPHTSYRETPSKVNSKFDLGDNPEILYTLAGVLQRALVLSWHDSAFKKALFSAHDAPVDIHKASLALNRWLGYHYPFKIHLVIKEDTRAVYTDPKPLDLPIDLDLDLLPGSWSDLSGNELQLCLPLPPDTTFHYPQALAAYNQDGAEFPFTCS